MRVFNDSTKGLMAAAVVVVCGTAYSHGGLTAREAGSRLEVVGIEPSGDAFARAVALRQPRLIELFIDAGTNPNTPDAAGRTPLFHAVAALNWRLAEKLLALGARPEMADHAGTNPLMLACAFGNADFARALVDRGAPIDVQDSAGRTALHYALAARRLPIAMQLIAAKARVDLRDCDGNDALAYAAETQNWPLLEAVLRETRGRTWDFAGRSTLQQAISFGDAQRVRLVMSRHVGAPTPEGCTSPLLAYAVAANDLRLTRLLLEAGADPNTTFEGPVEARFLEYIPQKFLRNYLSEEAGMTVLMVAAGLGHTEVLKTLVALGAERGRTTRSKYRLVPIYFAAWGEHAECIQALIAGAPSPEKYRIEISLRSQNATFYRDGVPFLSTDISTGKTGFATPTGQFVITDKKATHVSTIYKVKMPFFMRLSCRDFGMHEGYVPDYPASHGCIRLPSEAARKLYKEVPIGTLVTIRN